ncbi:hypothetical protein PENTCL1PPCAC_14885, partial [Pristionchus entomophagus]
NMIDQVEASSLLAVISLIGIITNALALYAVVHYKHRHNTFGALCVLLATANFAVLLIHLLWSACAPFLFYESTISGTTGKMVGQIGVFFLDVKVYAHLGASMNRLFSLLFPFEDRRTI